MQKSSTMSNLGAASAVFVLVACALALTAVNAVRVGDEQFANAPLGMFYTFSSEEIHIIDPASGEVVKTVKADGAGRWGDVVYVQSPDGSKAFAVGVDRDNHLVYVLDALTGDLVERIAIGENPVHVYGVYKRGEVWIHSDNDGHFDVWRVDGPGKLLVEGFKAHVDVPGHGKLLFDPELGDVGYATNTNEQGIYELDLKAKTHMDGNIIFHNFTEINAEGVPCIGTHGIAYSRINDHVYVECTGSGGTFEYNRKTQKVVAIFPDVLGQVYTTPDENFVMAVAKTDSTVHLIEPQKPGKPSKWDKSFAVAGSPDKVVFKPKQLQENDVELRDFEAWFALTEDSEDAGAAVVDLDEAIKSLDGSKAVTVIPAGTVNRGARFTHRNIARGGKWVAIPTHLPEHTLSIIDSETKLLAHQVKGMTNMSRVLWVPVPLQSKATLQNADEEEKVVCKNSALGSSPMVFTIFVAIIVVFGHVWWM